MTSKAALRDPRIDPQTGDVVRKGERERRVVRRVGNDVYYDTGASAKIRGCWITTWQTWSQNAVFARGNDRSHLQHIGDTSTKG